MRGLPDVIFLSYCFLIKTNRAIVDHRPIRIGNRQWSSVAKIFPPPRRPPPARGERVRHTPRRATRGSPAPHSGAADDEAHRRPYLARAEDLSAQRTRRIVAEMLAIDPTPGFFVHSQIARISVARTGERTMMREADLAATDRIVRPTGELDPCRRVAPTRSPRRRRGTKRRSKPRGNFSCLQILEKPQNGIGISHGSVCDPAAPRAWRLHTFSRPGHSDIRATGRPKKTFRGMSSTPLIELTVEFDRYFGLARLPPTEQESASRACPAQGSGNAARSSGKIILPAKP